MKKIYVCAIVLSIGTLSFAQSLKQETIPFKDLNNIESAKPYTTQNKGATIWSNDFDTIAQWNITNDAGNSDDWVIGTTAPSGAFAINGITSTSGGNFALFDSDLLCSGNQDASIAMATPLDLTGFPNVTLEFEEYYRRFQGNTYIGVSTNGGTTWTDIEVNANTPVNDFNEGANVNPHLVTVNISSLAGNQSSVLIRFHYVGGCDYAWMVDDVKIVETDDHDLLANQAYYGFNGVPYTRIPSNHIQSADFSMFASNVGSTDQTNVVLSVEDNGTVVSTGTPSTVIVGANDSLSAPSYTPPTTTGVPHVFTLTLSADSADDSPANNSLSFEPFEISTDIYALDDFGANGIGNAGGDNATSPGAFEFEAGNFFDAVVNDVVGSITVVIGTNTVSGTVIDAVLYELDATGTFIEVSRSGFYTTTAADAGNAVTLPLATPANPAIVAGGNYFAAIHAFTEFFYGTSGSSPGQGTPGGTQSLIFYPNMTAPNTGENFFTTATPMVRVNTGMSIGVEELNNNIDFAVSPNPSNGVFNLDLTAQTTENINLTVRNIVGQIILTNTLSVSGQVREPISLTNYDKGIYFLSIDSSNETKTIKLIVE